MAIKSSSDLPPHWVRRLGVAVWVTGPDSTITYINARAERLIGVPAARCLGRPCRQLIAAVDAEGQPVCGEACLLVSHILSGADAEPLDVQITGADRRQRKWVQILPIPVGGETRGRRPSIVHCVQETARAHSLSDFFGRVALRSPGSPDRNDAAMFAALTPRERQVLMLLADDQTVHAIALSLGVSYTTVRNHIQHLLEKLDAHSILEAVARYLLLERRGD